MLLSMVGCACRLYRRHAVAWTRPQAVQATVVPTNGAAWDMPRCVGGVPPARSTRQYVKRSSAVTTTVAQSASSHQPARSADFVVVPVCCRRLPCWAWVCQHACAAPVRGRIGLWAQHPGRNSSCGECTCSVSAAAGQCVGRSCSGPRAGTHACRVLCR